MLRRFLATLFHSSASESAPAISAARPPSVNRDVLPELRRPVEGYWRDDSEIKALAEDARHNVTNWVFAHDLLELYAHIERHNKAHSADEHIHIDMWSEASDKVAEWRGNEWHNPDKNGVKAKGTLVLKGEMILKAFGPSAFNGLRLHIGNEVLHATYFHTGMETYLTVNGPNVDDQKIYFKGSGPDSFAQVTKMAPLMP